MFIRKGNVRADPVVSVARSCLPSRRPPLVANTFDLVFNKRNGSGDSNRGSGKGSQFGEVVGGVVALVIIVGFNPREVEIMGIVEEGLFKVEDNGRLVSDTAQCFDRRFAVRKNINNMVTFGGPKDCVLDS